MTTGVDISSALLNARTVTAPAASTNAAVTKKASQQFEAVFISQFLGSMFADIPTDGPFGGGPGEEMFRSLMVDQYGQNIEKQGGFGLAPAVQRQLLKLQEARG